MINDVPKLETAGEPEIFLKSPVQIEIIDF